MEAREVLAGYVQAPGALELVDPLAPNRQIGKTYIWPDGAGWEISGFYRRGADDRWHPFLLGLDGTLRPVSLKLRDDDPALVARGATDPTLDVTAK